MSILLIMAIQYDFDKIVERRGTGAIKVDAMKERVEHPILGYTSDQ